MVPSQGRYDHGRIEFHGSRKLNKFARLLTSLKTYRSIWNWLWHGTVDSKAAVMLGRLQQWMRPGCLKLTSSDYRSSKVKYVGYIFTWQPAELFDWYFLVFGCPMCPIAF